MWLNPSTTKRFIFKFLTKVTDSEISAGRDNLSLPQPFQKNPQWIAWM